MAGATQVASLFATVGADLSPLKKGLKQAQGDIQRSGGGIKRALGGIATAAAGIATVGVGGVVALGGGIAKLAMDAAPLEGIRASFDRLTESIGQGSKATLESLREASRGMITDTELMKSFNEAIMLTGDSMGREFPKLMEIAQASAAATGQDMSFMLDSLVKGIGRASPMILDNLGLTIDLSEAYEKFGATVGVAAKDLTKAQQQQAILNAVIAQGDTFIEKMGGELGDSQVAMAQLRTTIGNLKDTIGSAFLPVLNAVLTPLSDMAQKHGPKLIEWSRMFAAWLEYKVIPAVSSFGRYLMGLASTVAEFGGSALQWLGGAIEQIGRIPSAIGLEGLAMKFEMVGEDVAEMGTGIKESLDKSAEAVENFGQAWYRNTDHVYRLTGELRPQQRILREMETSFAGYGDEGEAAIEKPAAKWWDFAKPAWDDMKRFWSVYLLPVHYELVELFNNYGQILEEAMPTAIDIAKGKWNELKVQIGKFVGFLADHILQVTGLKQKYERFMSDIELVKKAFRLLFFWLEDVNRELEKFLHLGGGISIPALPGGGGGGGGVGAAPGGAGPVASARTGSPTVVVVPLDRREFTQPNGELDYMVMGDRLTRERLY